jgi:hypothetical protein
MGAKIHALDTYDQEAGWALGELGRFGEEKNRFPMPGLETKYSYRTVKVQVKLKQSHYRSGLMLI